MSRRSLAALIAGAAAAMAYYFLVARPPGFNAYLIFYLGTPAIALAFLAAGIAAWLRWPSSRLGLLFSIAGYLYLLPALNYLNDAPAFTLREPGHSLLRRRPGSPGPGLAHREAPLPVRARGGRGRIRHRGRLQRAQHDVLGSRLQRLLRRVPGQPAARPRVPAGLGCRQRDHRRGQRRAHRHPGDPDHPALAVGARLVAAGHGAAGVDRPGDRRGVPGQQRHRAVPPAADGQPDRQRVGPAGGPARPGAVRDQHGARPDGTRRARHRDRRPGTGRATGPAQGHAGPGAGRFDPAARVPGRGTASPIPRAWRWTRRSRIRGGRWSR